MIHVFGREFSLVVLLATAIHVTWAMIILLDPAAIGATPLSPVFLWIRPVFVLSMILLLSAGLSLWGMATRVSFFLLLLIPQQVILLITAAGAAEAIYLQHYADGVARSWGFITVDQCYSIYVAIGHTLAIILHATRMMSRQ